MSNVNQNTSLDQLELMYDNMEELQGYGADDSVISYQEYAEMTEEQREAYLESFIAQAELTAEEATEIEEALSEKLDEFHDMLREARAYLESLLNDDSSDAGLKARSQVLLEDVNELIEGSDAKDFSADWGESLQAVQERNQSIETRGTATSVSTDNAEHGDVYTVDATKMEDAEGAAGSTSYFDSYDNAQTEDWNWNVDTNEDGVIDETDNPEYGETPTTIDLSDIPSDAQVTASVESGNPTVITLHVIEEDGTEYDVQLILDPADIEDGNLNIILGTVPTNVDHLPKEINGIFYEKHSSENPYSHYTHDYRPNDSEVTRTLVNTNDFEDYSYTYTPSKEDFEQSRDVTVECGVNGEVTIDVSEYEDMYGEDVYVTIAEGETEGEIIITLTTESGETTTITLENVKTSGVHANRINITGGTLQTNSTQLKQMTKPVSAGGNSTRHDYYASIIYHNSSTDSLADDNWVTQYTGDTTIEQEAEMLGYDLAQYALDKDIELELLLNLIDSLMENQDWTLQEAMDYIIQFVYGE